MRAGSELKRSALPSPDGWPTVGKARQRRHRYGDNMASEGHSKRPDALELIGPGFAVEAFPELPAAAGQVNKSEHELAAGWIRNKQGLSAFSETNGKLLVRRCFQLHRLASTRRA